MARDCVKASYYCCFFVACFGCIGTFASFLFERSNKSLNKKTNDYFKVSCPALVVASFAVMGILRCSTRKSRNGRRQQMGPDEQNRSVSRNNAIYFSDNTFLDNPPSYAETMRNSQSIEPPPKYEDIAMQGWKTEDRVLQQHVGEHSRTSRAEAFTITQPQRDNTLVRDMASNRAFCLDSDREVTVD